MHNLENGFTKVSSVHRRRHNFCLFSFCQFFFQSLCFKMLFGLNTKILGMCSIMLTNTNQIRVFKICSFSTLITGLYLFYQRKSLLNSKKEQKLSKHLTQTGTRSLLESTVYRRSTRPTHNYITQFAVPQKNETRKRKLKPFIHGDSMITHNGLL